MPHYARVLLGLARDKGFKGIVANRGQAAITLAKQYLPTAITLDVFLPDMLGWTVLNNLKLDPATRHIPVQMLSVEEERQHGLSHGAFSYLVKPATTEDLEHAFDRIKTYVAPHKKRLLVIEDNDIERQSIVELLAHDDIEVAAVGTGAEALRAPRRPAVRLLRRRSAAAGHERLRAAGADAGGRGAARPAGRRVHRQGAVERRRGAAEARGEEHRPQGRAVAGAAVRRNRAVPPPRGRGPARTASGSMLERLHGSNDVLRQRKVLVVDDDARNIFALTTVLENQEMEVVSATNGRQAIELIQNRRRT